MAERKHRAVRMGIDVGGTYTKCVAMDNETHEIRLKLHMTTRAALLPVLFRVFRIVCGKMTLHRKM